MTEQINETTPNHWNLHPALNAVRQASQTWVAHFNKSNIDVCVAGYLADSIMDVKSVGSFKGTAAIDAFWRPFMEAGAGDLVYRNVVLTLVDEKTVLLRADWSMNVGHGIITEERWVLCEDGNWKLSYDAFEIQEQYTKD